MFRASHALLTPERADAALAGDPRSRPTVLWRALAGEPPLMLPTRTANRNHSSGTPAKLVLHFTILDVHYYRRCAVVVGTRHRHSPSDSHSCHSPAGPPVVVASLDLAQT